MTGPQPTAPPFSVVRALRLRGLGALALGLALLVAAPLPELRAASDGEEAVQDQDAYADHPVDAGKFLQELGERAVEELTVGSITEDERERRFRTLFRQSFDLGAIGKFVLGKYWRRANQQQQDAFLDVFEDGVVQRFLPMFKAYSGETFSIGRLRRDESNPSHVFVTTNIVAGGGEEVKVEWRLRERVATRTYKIIDVQAEGVSMAITLRQEYASVVRQSGLDYLIDQLRQKVDAGAFAPAGN